MRRRALIALAAAAAGVAPAAVLADASSLPPKRYFVLAHAPGPKWDSTKGFRQQVGIDQHETYMQDFFDRGTLVLGGPYLDNSGGMMIFDLDSAEDAQRVAEGDPTVRSGLLAVTVKPWLAVFRQG
ncbi:MAG TPA: YciI family protein [Caulobacteraceae bacterium]|nr:YciI family protein [Caulobacteraceae bacterium]